MQDQILIITSPVKFVDIQDKVSWHSDYIKGVADLANSRISLGGELHADGEKKLLEARTTDNQFLWGFNLYPNQEIEFESLINIKPKLGNKSIVIADPEIATQVKKLIFELIKF